MTIVVFQKKKKQTKIWRPNEREYTDTVVRRYISVAKTLPTRRTLERVVKNVSFLLINFGYVNRTTIHIYTRIEARIILEYYVRRNEKDREISVHGVYSFV